MANENLGSLDLQLSNQALNITTTPTCNSKIGQRNNIYHFQRKSISPEKLEPPYSMTPIDLFQFVLTDNSIPEIQS
jgi:hypothetical protein